jgi:primosomal protein N'
MEQGKFDFTGDRDVAEFVRLIQKNGMYCILRPGPYVCAEWDMGGSGDDTSTDDTGGDTSAGADTTATESRKYTAAEVKKILRENSNKHKLNEAQRKRLREVSKHYKEVKEDLFFHYLENQHLTEYTNKAGNQHVLYVPKLTENTAEWEAVQVIKHNSNAEASGHLKEEGPEEMVQDEMNKLQEQQYTKEEIAMNTKIEKMAAEAIQNADKIS